MSLHHNMFPHLLIYPQIFLLLRQVRRGRRASSSPSTSSRVEGCGRPASREVKSAAAVPPCSSGLCQAACFSRFSPERHTRSVPSRGRRREEKGSVVFLSSFLRLTGLLTDSDSPDGNPRWLSRPLLLQGLRPRLICLCPDLGERGRERRKRKPTNFL